MKVLNIVLPALFVCSLVHADVTKLSLKSQQAANVLTEIVAIPDKSIPLSLIERSSCIAVVPNVIRAGFIFGARYGKGLVSCRVANGWSSPLFIDVTGGSWGLQFGIQSIDLVLVFTRPNAAQKFSQPNFRAKKQIG